MHMETARSVMGKHSRHSAQPGIPDGKAGGGIALLSRRVRDGKQKFAKLGEGIVYRQP